MRILEIPEGRFRWLRRLVVVAVVVQFFATGSGNALGRIPAVLAIEPPPSQGHGLEVRPASITYSPTGYLVGKPTFSGPPGRLHWRRWTKQAALGSGYDTVPKTNCIICKHGFSSFYPVRIRLHRARVEHGSLVFTRMTITYTKRTPPRHPRSRTLDLMFADGTFNWGPAFGSAVRSRGRQVEQDTGRL